MQNQANFKLYCEAPPKHLCRGWCYTKLINLNFTSYKVFSFLFSRFYLINVSSVSFRHVSIFKLLLMKYIQFITHGHSTFDKVQFDIQQQK